jgi:autotransporter-associated beta strand protein
MVNIASLWESKKRVLHRPADGRKSLRFEQLEDRALLTLLGQSLFPADNPWNQNISQAPVAANSTAVINAIINAYGDHHLHPDFGQDYQAPDTPLYGIPYNVVHGDSVPKVNVVIDAYASESDIEPAPIPANAVLEGDTPTGPTVGQGNRGDSHLIVWDEDNNIDYEFFAASRPSENADGMWHADSETVWNMNTNTFRTLGWTSADAAGLPILPGLTRPDEGLPISEGGQGAIDHAIRFTLENPVILDQFLYPASHVANPGNNDPTIQPPMGARFRLKASVDISMLNPESQIIARALQQYGMILADNGGNFFISGASYSVDANNNFALTWNDNDIQDTAYGLKSLPFSDFEMVNLTPIVTGLSVASGAAAAQVTVIGQNFSGAAGHLQVLFGNVPSTSVTVIDDNHVSAVAPPGSGTVDVTVQSGIADPNDPSNINSPIFGYGVSAVSAADKFTYVAPLVVTAADWTAAGLTLMLGGDGDLHVYITGPSPPVDAIPPVAAASVSSIEIASPSSNAANLTIDSSNGNPIPAGGFTYSGSGGLIKAGPGSVTLSDANTFTGDTDVAAGMLVVNTVKGIPNDSSLAVGAGAASIFSSTDLRGYSESFHDIWCILTKARSASEECAPTSGESRFLGDHASMMLASGFNGTATRLLQDDKLRSYLGPLPEPLRLAVDGGNVLHDDLDMAATGSIEEIAEILPRPIGVPVVFGKDRRAGFAAHHVVTADLGDHAGRVAPGTDGYFSQIGNLSQDVDLLIKRLAATVVG